MINVGDKYIFHYENGQDYDIKVVNINTYRPPNMKYGCDVFDKNGNYAGDVLFFGEDFFDKCKKCVD